MTVAEMIEALQQIENKNTPVVISGYEGGFKDITDISPLDIVLNVNTAWYYGPHDYHCFFKHQDQQTVKAIQLC